MDGILHVINDLGIGLAAMKAEIARLTQENAALREQIAAAAPPEPQDTHSP